jgi:hypothetical protein
VAAFFALNEAKEDKEVAIYTFREYLGNGKNSSLSEPFIWGLGPYIRTHKRHYQQQSRYTYSITGKKDPGENHIYGNHESVKYGNDQDLLKKYIIPGKERNKVLAKLDLMNINAFSLFSDEEGLMSMLAYREIKRKESPSIEG